MFTLCLVHNELSPLSTSQRARHWPIASQVAKVAGNFPRGASLVTAAVPGDWKAAVICQIFKKGDPEDVGTYRSVSLASVVSKVFERIFKRAGAPRLEGLSKYRWVFVGSHPSQYESLNFGTGSPLLLPPLCFF